MTTNFHTYTLDHLAGILRLSECNGKRTDSPVFVVYDRGDPFDEVFCITGFEIGEFDQIILKVELQDDVEARANPKPPFVPYGYSNYYEKSNPDRIVSANNKRHAKNLLGLDSVRNIRMVQEGQNE